jgi:hypothetical protein
LLLGMQVSWENTLPPATGALWYGTHAHDFVFRDLQP